MNDYELSLLTDWRYTNVKDNDKVPYPNNWQNTPHTLNNITSSNIGVILGIASNGLCAIDFDGIEAIDYWNTQFNIEIDKLDTVMWTSGKEYRCQAAFTVPEIYWDTLKKKVINKLEFRWTGGQSVLPPSKLYDGRQYMWINKPSNTSVKEIPEVVLCHWLDLIYKDITKYDHINTKYEQLTTVDEEFVNELLDRISKRVGNLRGDYDVWRTIAWATCSSVGINTAKMLMLYYWPDKTKKELQTLLSWKPRSDSPKIGTLIKLSGISSEERKLLELENKLRRIK